MKAIEKAQREKQAYRKMIEEAKAAEYGTQPADRKTVLRSSLLLYGMILVGLLLAALAVRLIGAGA